jgi:hypothetical protein
VPASDAPESTGNLLIYQGKIPFRPRREMGAGKKQYPFDLPEGTGKLPKFSERSAGSEHPDP